MRNKILNYNWDKPELKAVKDKYPHFFSLVFARRRMKNNEEKKPSKMKYIIEGTITVGLFVAFLYCMLYLAQIAENVRLP